MFSKFFIAAIFAVFAFGLFFSSPTNAQGCELGYQAMEEVNLLSMNLDCPDMEEGYRAFNFGDGSEFDVWLNSQGDSSEFTHAYPYEEGGIITYTASINSDAMGDVDYYFYVVIDDYSEPDFWVGDVEMNNPDTWDWPVVIRPEGVFTFTVDTTCNGLAGNHNGLFQWAIEGPYGPEANVMFGNWVNLWFVKETLVPTSLTVVNAQRQEVFVQEVLAPTCEVPKPQIVVEDREYFQGDEMPVQIISPEGAVSVNLGTDNVIFEYPQPACQVMGDVPVHGVTCEPGSHQIKVRVGQDAESVYLFSRSWFDEPVVESSSELTVTVIPDDIVAVEPACNLQVEEGSSFNNFGFQAFWSNATKVELDFGDGTSTEFAPELTEGGTNHDYGWDTTTGTSVYTATLKVSGQETDVSCTTKVVVTDPNFEEEPEAPEEPENPEIPRQYKAHLALIVGPPSAIFVYEDPNPFDCTIFEFEIAADGLACVAHETLYTSSDVYVSWDNSFYPEELQVGPEKVIQPGQYVYMPWGGTFHR